ncbi:acyl-CoA-binding domain-containing protein 5-like [Uloborus diversus]|uniref:acyl-CoA-binding domain-containing protein 5-like n=1 Tax=Uloborus diversus TaxID=327109 RepID=UPI00240A6658|nr:acyl-CoA-binding domain-containing protein 5-like [Uloborus diversus]
MLNNLTAMEVATTEEKFHAAVELIKNLPRSGSFQPSNELKLKFYSYFKQATDGPCELPKPSFWDVVNRAKWDAWNRLGNMSKEEAMTNYVQEFVRILEETPLEDPKVLDDYIHIMGPYIHYAPKEYREKTLLNGKAKLIGDKSEDLNERKNVTSPSKPLKGYKNEESDDEDKYPSAVNGHNMNGSNESDSEEFSDTLERVDESDTDETLKTSSNSYAGNNNPVSEVKGSNIISVRGGGEQRVGAVDTNSPAAGPSGNRGSRSSRQARNSDNPLQYSSNNNVSGSGGSRRSGGNLPPELAFDANEQLAMAIIRLHNAMEQVIVRLESLETIIAQRLGNPATMQIARNRSPWSLFGISPKAALIILAWPFIVQWLIYLIRKRNRRL